MTNPIDTNETSMDVTDPELEQLLSDAFDAPPIPRSLLRRIDQDVEREWGESPRLADSAAAKVSRGVARSARWVRTLPIAAAVGIIIALGVMFRSNAPAYAWAQLVEALSQQNVVEVESENVKRWLAVSEKLISEESAESTHLLDLREQVTLQRKRGASEIQRSSLQSTSAATDEQMVLAFLTGNSHENGHQLEGVKVISESATVAENGQIVLGVTFEGMDRRTFSLQAFVDPQSRLPQKLKVAGDSVESQSLVVSYPVVTVAERRAVEFPGEMQIVDANEIRTALNDTPEVTPAPAKDDVEVVAVQDAVTLPPTPDVAVKVKNEPDEPAQEVAFVGAASRWQPVKVVPRSSDVALQQLDAAMENLWEQNGVTPAAAADAEELLRRVYLDLAGRTPSVTEVREYDGDKSPDRYKNLVDRLLDSPDHATHLATMYRTFLIPEGIDLTAFGGIEAFDKWLSERFSSNDSYDEVVRSLLLAEGRLSRSGPLLFYSATKLDPDQLASRTSRVFLGMRLECAQCHDHPFEPWTQQDFWSYAAFFARISRPQGELENVSTVMRVRDIDRGEVMIPDSDEVVPPRFLNAVKPLAEQQADGRRQVLARWLTGADNPYFPRATANRVWGQMFGRGLVDPIDDFGVENPPVSAEVLDLLASHFIHSKFNLREMFRIVALSRAYQLSSGMEDLDENRIDLFAQMNVKTLTAEQVYDCITVATMPSGTGSVGFNVDRFSNSSREQFLQQFRTPTGRPVEYLGGIPQALTLMNGTLTDGATGLSRSGLLQSLDAPFFTNKQRVEVLYFATLSRRPKPVEWELLNEYIDDSTSGAELKENLADVLWALLNSAEFSMNH